MDTDLLDGEDADADDMDPSVPTDLLELHVELEEKNTSPEKFKEVFG